MSKNFVRCRRHFISGNLNDKKTFRELVLAIEWPWMLRVGRENIRANCKWMYLQALGLLSSHRSCLLATAKGPPALANSYGQHGAKTDTLGFNQAPSSLAEANFFSNRICFRVGRDQIS